MKEGKPWSHAGLGFTSWHHHLQCDPEHIFTQPPGKLFSSM